VETNIACKTSQEEASNNRRRERPVREETPVRELRPALDTPQSETNAVSAEHAASKGREERPARPQRQPRPPRNQSEAQETPATDTPDELVETQEAALPETNNREPGERPQRRTRGQRRRSNRSERQQSSPGWQNPMEQAEAESSTDIEEQEHEPVIVRIINPHDDRPAAPALVIEKAAEVKTEPPLAVTDSSAQPVDSQIEAVATSAEAPATPKPDTPPAQVAEEVVSVSEAVKAEAKVGGLEELPAPLPLEAEPQAVVEVPAPVQAAEPAVQPAPEAPSRPAPKQMSQEAPKRAPNDPREVRRRLEAERKKQSVHPLVVEPSLELSHKPPQSAEKALLARAITEAVLHIDHSRPAVQKPAESLAPILEVSPAVVESAEQELRP